MENHIILGVVGLIASGKGTIGSYTASTYDAAVFRYSTMLRDVLGRLYLPHTRENMQTLSTMLRQTFDEELMARVMMEDIKKVSNELIVVEGIRRMADIISLKHLPGFTLVAVVADEKVRYERNMSRLENAEDQTMTFEYWKSRHQAEADVQIPDIMKEANVTLDNNGTPEELYQQIDQLIERLHNERKG